jgi:hypothetical protein
MVDGAPGTGEPGVALAELVRGRRAGFLAAAGSA